MSFLPLSFLFNLDLIVFPLIQIIHFFSSMEIKMGYTTLEITGARMVDLDCIGAKASHNKWSIGIMHIGRILISSLGLVVMDAGSIFFLPIDDGACKVAPSSGQATS